MSKAFTHLLAARLIRRRSHKCRFDKIKPFFGKKFLQCPICRRTKRG